MARAWTDADIETMRPDAVRVLHEGAKVPATCIVCLGTLSVNDSTDVYMEKKAAKVSCPNCEQSFYI